MTNKTNSIIKIIAGAVAAVLLLGILVVLIQINASLKAQDTTASITDEVDIADSYNEESANGDIDESAVTTVAEASETPEVTTTTAATTTTAPTTSNATSSSNSNYSSATGDFTMDTSGITDIEIDWYSGSVTVIPYSGTTIQVSETSSSNISSSNVLYYTVNKYGELKINFNSSKNFSSAGISKDLTVYIPTSMSLDELSVEATAADIVISDAQGTLSVRDLSVETTSGNSTIKGITATEMSADATSGAISISSCTISQELDIEITSGSATIALPSGTGYTLEYETTSGTVTASGSSLNGEGRTTVGTGNLKIDVETTSGNVTITN